MNLVVMVLDTLRYDCVHHKEAPGIAKVSTPHFDALRRDGVSFSAAYGEAEPTVPVRRALWTGLRSFPWRFDYDTKGLWPNARGWHKIPPPRFRGARPLDRVVARVTSFPGGPALL